MIENLIIILLSSFFTSFIGVALIHGIFPEKYSAFVRLLPLPHLTTILVTIYIFDIKNLLTIMFGLAISQLYYYLLKKIGLNLEKLNKAPVKNNINYTSGSVNKTRSTRTENTDSNSGRFGGGSSGGAGAKGKW